MPFEDLRECLLAGGIAPRRVKRYLAELDDHLAELTTRERAAGHDPEDADKRARALLGSDDELAAALLAFPELRSFTARVPWAVFVLLPPFAVLLAFLVPVLIMILIARSHGMISAHNMAAPLWYRHLMAPLSLASNLLLPGAVAVLLVALATRQRLSPLWPLIGIALIVAAGVQWHAAFPLPGHRGGSISVGLWFLDAKSRWQHWQLGLAQSILALLPVTWMYFARQRRLRL